MCQKVGAGIASLTTDGDQTLATVLLVEDPSGTEEAPGT